MSHGGDRSERCPKCEELRSHPDECPHCGVVFAKIHVKTEPRRESAARPAEASGPAGRERSRPDPSGGRRLGFLLILLALASALLAVANLDRDRRARADLEIAADARVAPSVESPTPPAEARARQPASEADEATGRRSRSESLESPARARRATPASPARGRDVARAVSASHNWYRGSDGFIRGMREATDENKAVLVYFYTDWCGYCRRLDRDLLSRVTVSGTTKYFVKIKVNPEDGRAERLLADRYGISGYPSLFVHEAGSPRATRIRTTTRGRLKRPSEFNDSLTRAAGERFTSG